MFDRLKALGESVLNPKEREKVAKEAAITAWENNPETNAENYKVVRGTDGRPVEIIMKDKRQAAFVVNGTERTFDVARLTDGSSFGDPIPSLCLDGVLKEGYDVRLVKALNYGKGGKPFTVLAGIATGLPAGLVVRR